MRINDRSIFERRKQSAEFKRNYFIAFEGYSEYQYFDGIKINRERLRINNTVDIQLLDRFHHDRSDSSPRNLVTKMDEYRKLISEGAYSVNLFIGDILQQLYEKRCVKQHSESRITCIKEIAKIKSELMIELKKSEFVESDYLKERTWNDATKFCIQYLSKKLSDSIDWIQTPPDRKIETYDEETDIFCLVVDRDKSSRPPSYYRYLLQDCEKYNISLYITNPCFEFWLLLHFDYSRNLPTESLDKLIENPNMYLKEEKIRLSSKLLLECVNDYQKQKIEFDKNFLKKVDNAIENAESYETQINALGDKIGSNIGKLIERMRTNT